MFAVPRFTKCSVKQSHTNHISLSPAMMQCTQIDSLWLRKKYNPAKEVYC